jgi:hypothetical protein
MTRIAMLALAATRNALRPGASSDLEFLVCAAAIALGRPLDKP